MAAPLAAVCVLAGAIAGVLRFSQPVPGGPLYIKGEIKSLTPGHHGFHVHEFGDLSDGCTSAGPHFNPFKKSHGAPTDSERHVGDMGNLIAGKDGVGKVDITDNLMSLSGDTSVIGRAIVVHADRDDLGKGGVELSKTTGNSGARVGCCIIGLAKPPEVQPVAPYSRY